MKINVTQPSITDFKKNEVKTLENINARSTILKNFPEVISSIQQSYYDNKSLLKNPAGDFLFHADFDMDIEGSVHKVLIGANVTGDYALCSYFLAVVGKENLKTELIRKFHFDYALPPQITPHQPSPVYHLQYGGKPTPQMSLLGIQDNLMEHWLSLPRLHFPPINIALLLDMVFCEFRSKKTKDIIEDPEWRSLIFYNENFLSNNYYINIRNHIKSGNYKRGALVRDFCYGT